MPSSDAARARLDVRLTPRASRVGVEVDGDVVRVRVTAPPIDGRANAALVELLSKRLGVPKREIAIERGQHSRTKRVSIEGVSTEAALDRLRVSK